MLFDFILFAGNFDLPFREPVLVFCLMLLIILLAPMLSERLGLPGIIGLILMGVLIGPHGLNVLERGESIVLFSTVGLLYLMFLGGLELEWNEFVRNRHRSLIFGGLTFIIPIAIGFPVCYYFLEYPLNSSILISSMFATHTLVAYPVASRLGILQNPVVPIAVGGTIITDTAVLLILAVITSSSSGTTDPMFWVEFAVKVIMFLTIIWLGLPMLARWVFKNFEGEKNAHFLFVLASVFFAAFLSLVAGIEPIVGAFMAGLGLNRLIPKTSLLMNRIEFVGSALFIPFFLVSVGMLVDLKVLFGGPQALIVAATLTIVAEIGKWVAAFFSQQFFGLSKPQRGVLFGLSSAHAAATLAVILVGYNLKLLDENVLNGTILLILVTCLVASFVTEKEGRKLALADAQRQPVLPEKEDRILIPIANPTTTESLLDLALLIRDPGDKQPVVPLSVVKDDNEANEKVRASRKLLEKAVAYAKANGAEVNPVTRVDLNISTGISRVAKELFITDIILGWHGKISLEDRIFGTILDSLLPNTCQQILVCRINQPWNTFRRVLIFAVPESEIDPGFANWVKKAGNFAAATSTSLVVFGTEKTSFFLGKELKSAHPKLKAEYIRKDEWEEIPAIAKHVKKDDLMVFISAREGTLSHTELSDWLPQTLSKNFDNHSFVLVYPEQPEAFLSSEPIFS